MPQLNLLGLHGLSEGREFEEGRIVKTRDVRSVARARGLAGPRHAPAPPEWLPHRGRESPRLTLSQRRRSECHYFPGGMLLAYPPRMPRPERLHSHGYVASLLFALVMIVLAWVWHPF